MSNEQLHFKANVGVKDIVGRGLIYDDNIAIIELIKNSRDASASKIDIEFLRETHRGKSSELIIADNGIGMSLSDIKDKWLNIAWSEKKNNAEKKIYAGNKGIGRFSCDRLGKQLVLYTKSRSGDYLKLPIDWERFEVHQKNAEVSSVLLDYEVMDKEDFLAEVGIDEFKTGAILKISDLRASWDEKKIASLKKELEKFLFSPDSSFEISLSYANKKPFKIENKVFQELAFRTYYIKSEISIDGSEIETALYYHGKEIYSYTAHNPYKHLKKIDLEIHYLNFTSKAYFKRRTGYSTVDYGSIFLFLNSFRVFPYGNPKNDWLGLDQRKSQGTARYLGTRELIGKVSIIDHENVFTPLTSREGIVQDQAFLELIAYDAEQKVTLQGGKESYGYVTNIIRQLERFIVSGLEWDSIIDLENPDSDKVISDTDLEKDPTRYALKQVDPEKLEEVIEKNIKLSGFDIIDFKIDHKLIKKLSDESADAYNEYILSFIKNTTNKNFEDFSSKDKEKLRRIAQDNMASLIAARESEKRAQEAEEKAKREKARAEEAERVSAEEKRRAEEAEQRAREAEKRAKKAQESLDDVKSENLFLRSDANKDLDHIVNLHHQIVLYCATAESEIENLKNMLSRHKTVPSENVLEYVLSIENDITKISKVSAFATNQKYKMALTSVSGNLVEFVSSYLTELNNNELMLKKIRVINKIDHSKKFKTEFSPLGVMILVDNLISNSKRARATQITFAPPVSPAGLFVVGDNGAGLHRSIHDSKKIFEKGFTTTEGSGRGLHHVMETLEDLKLGIRVVEDQSQFTGLVMEIFKDVN